MKQAFEFLAIVNQFYPLPIGHGRHGLFIADDGRLMFSFKHLDAQPRFSTLILDEEDLELTPGELWAKCLPFVRHAT